MPPRFPHAKGRAPATHPAAPRRACRGRRHAARACSPRRGRYPPRRSARSCRLGTPRRRRTQKRRPTIHRQAVEGAAVVEAPRRAAARPRTGRFLRGNGSEAQSSPFPRLSNACTYVVVLWCVTDLSTMPPTLEAQSLLRFCARSARPREWWSGTIVVHLRRC